MSHSQFRLLRERRFLPFFGTQALGAFNDNVYKNALVLIATYETASYTTMNPGLLSMLGNALFIVPFVIFSGISGQLADRFDKAVVMRIVKACEVGIMALAGLGFSTHNIVLLLAALFLMGAHSTFFAPAKYGLLPQVLTEDELVGGNALLEMGTFVAILLGTLLAGVLATRHELPPLVGALGLIALVGLGSSLLIPPVAPATALDAREHARGARRSDRVPVDPRHLVVLVLRHSGARAVAGFFEARAEWHRERVHDAADRVLDRRRHGLADVRAALGPAARDRSRPARLARAHGIRH